MKKKLCCISALTFASLMVVGTLSSCGSKARTADFVVPEEFTSDSIEINFWSTQGDALQAITDGAITRLQAKYPNIKVVHTTKSNYDSLRDDVSTNIPVGGNPDIAYCYPDHVALYNDANVVVPLDDLVNNKTFGYTKEEQSDFVESFFIEGKTFGDGKMYTMPFVKSTEVLYYNKTFFDANNLTVPQTWDEVWSVAAQIKQIDPTCYPLGYDSEANWFITLAAQYGYDYTAIDKDGNGQFLFENEGMKAVVNDLKAKYDQGLFTTQNIYGDYTSNLFCADTVSNANAKTCYMCIGSTGGATYQSPAATSKRQFEVGVAAYPQLSKDGSKGNKAVIQQGPSLVLFKNDDPQKVLAAWLFLKELLTPETMNAVAKNNGYIPCTTSALNSSEIQEWLKTAAGNRNGMKAYAAKIAIEQKDNYFVSPAFLGSSTARDQVGLIITNVLSGVDTDKAFTAAMKECQRAVA